MSERVRNIIVGITMLLGIVGVAMMMLLFGYAPAWLERGYSVTIQMNSASGLAVGSRARMSGTNVGRVTSVRMTEPPNWGVVLEVMIKEAVRLPVGVRVSVESPIVGGSPALTFEPPVQSGGPMIPTDGQGLIEVKYNVPTLASKFAAELRSALRASVGDLKAEFDKAQGKFEALSKTWIEVGRNVNALVEPLSPAMVDRDETGSTLGNLATVLARADMRLRQIEYVVDGLNQWVSDDQLLQHTRKLVSNTNQVVLKINGGVDRLTATATGAGQTFDRLVGKFIDVADDLSKAFSSLRHIVDQAAEGGGTIGKALNDPGLYQNMDDAAERLGKVLDEIRMLVEKWQTEGLPVKF